MKILFIGMGLTHYYNQVLNKLHDEADMEIFNLVKSGGISGVAKTSKAVFQTKDGVKFNIVELDEIIKDKFSDNHYISYRGLASWLKEHKPDSVVFASSFLKIFLYDKEVIEIMNELNIKIIRKDIPFRMDTYLETKRKIHAGELDLNYVAFFVPMFANLCNRLKLRKLPLYVGKFLGTIGLSKLYTKLIGRRVLLKQLEDTKRILLLSDAHVNYTGKAFELFPTYGVSKEKIFIMQNSPDTDILFTIREKIEQEAPILPTNPYRLIHIGRLIPWKRVDMLIEAHNELKKEFRGAELLIAGYGPIEDELKSLAKSLDCEDSVKFLGGVYDPAELGKYIQASSIYVLAGMGGISINDAMVFGRPVICSICDGTEAALVKEGYNGLYFENGNKDSLVEKIRHLFRNPDLMQKMGEHSTQIIRDEVNIHTVVNGYRKAFEYALKK